MKEFITDDGVRRFEIGPFSICLYWIRFDFSRGSLMWGTPWAYDDFHLKSYLWSYLPDDEHIWGVVLGLEYCWRR